MYYPILSGAITGAIAVVVFQLLPKKWNIWLRGIIAILATTILACIVRLIAGPF